MAEQNNSGLQGLYRNLKISYTTFFFNWFFSAKLNVVFIRLSNYRSMEEPYII